MAYMRRLRIVNVAKEDIKRVRRERLKNLRRVSIDNGLCLVAVEVGEGLGLMKEDREESKDQRIEAP